MNNFEKPDKGHKPKKVWDNLPGKFGGLGAEEQNTLWKAMERSLEVSHVGDELSGETVIELGCGDSDKSSRFRDYCATHNTAKYIGVDLSYTPKNPPDKIKNTKIEYVTGEKGDALSFLSTQPDDSAIIAQIMLFRDELIREGCRKFGLDPSTVAEELINEVARVQKSGKPLICVGAGPIFQEVLKKNNLLTETSPLTFVKREKQS